MEEMKFPAGRAAQWLQCWPEEWRVAGLVPVKVTYLGCRLDPQPWSGAPIDASLSH